MRITLEVPEDIGRSIASVSGSVDHAALEGLAAEAYRSGGISEQQLMRLLELPSRSAVHDWLAARHIPLQYSEADVAADLETLRQLGLL